MFLRLSAGPLLAALCVLLSACGSVDAGAVPGSNSDGDGYLDQAAVPQGSRELILISDEQLALIYGEQAAVQVALRSSLDGTPVVGAHVSFSLQGRQDSTVSALSVPTDEAGIAENTLTAGELTGAFTLEVSAPGASSLTVQVAVSDAGFGMLVVEAPYDGDRLVTRRRIAVVADVACDAVEPGPGDHMVLLSDPMAASGEFLLPAGQRYTVAALADGDDGTLLAQGCAPSIAIADQQATVAVIAFEDLPLATVGSYQLEATLDADRPAATLADAFALGATETLETDAQGVREPEGAEARLLLDALGQVLRADPYDADAMGLADAIDAERATPTLTPTLGEQLQAGLDAGDEDRGPRAAIEALTAQIEAAVAETGLAVQIDIDDAVRWQPVGVSSAPLDGDLQRVSLELDAQPPATVPLSPLPTGDGIELSALRFDLPWGALAARAARQLASDGLGGYDADLRQRFGCEALATFVLQLPLAGGMCDADCAADACDTAIGSVLDGGSAALTALGAARPAVTIDAQLLLYDDTGDLGVDRMATSQLLGTWEPVEAQDPGEAFNGGATGELVVAELVAQ